MSYPLVMLETVATFINGDRGKNYPSKGSFIDKGIPFISAGNLSGGLLDVSSFNYISKERFDLLSNGKVKNDDILFCLRGSLGKFAVVKGLEKGAIASSLVIIRNNKNIQLSILKHYLGSPLCRREINQFENGAAQPNLSAKDLKSFKIPLPSLKEQRKIAEILDTADSLRQKDQQLVEHYDRLSQSLFLDMFGDSVANPKSWEVKKLKELSIKIHSGNTPKGGSKVYVDKGVAFFRSQNVWKNRLELDDIVYIDKETHSKMSKSSLKNKDILMTKTGRINTENSSLGRAAMFLGEDDTANVNGHVYLVRLKEDVINEFILFILTSIEYRDYIRSVCVGGIDKRQLNKDHLENFPIISPPLDLQEKFVEQLKQITKQKELAQQSLKKSDDLFNGLLQKAFKGELTDS